MFDWLKQLHQHVPVRCSVWLLCGVGLLACAIGWALGDMGGWLVPAFALLAGHGVRDTHQTRHSVLRNYPVVGHLRLLLDFIRPEMRQYLIESDNEAAP